MEKTRAWEMLHDPEYCSQLDMGEMRALMVRAGYSEETAHEAAMQRGWERLSAGVTI